MTANALKIPSTIDHGYAPPDYLLATARLVAPIKARTYAQLQLREGQRVLDVGCGVGIDVFQIAEMVGPHGLVVGVDGDGEMVQQARAATVLPQVKFELASAQALPWDAASFDAVRSERMFQHILQPELALAEMCRVTRFGGRVVVLDTDWGSLSINAPNTDLERRLTQFKAAGVLRNGYSGRRLTALFRHAPIANVSIEVLPMSTQSYATARLACALDDLATRAIQSGLVSATEMDDYEQQLLAQDAAGEFFASVSMILVAGTRN